MVSLVNIKMDQPKRLLVRSWVENSFVGLVLDQSGHVIYHLPSFDGYIGGRALSRFPCNYDR